MAKKEKSKSSTSNIWVILGIIVAALAFIVIAYAISRVNQPPEFQPVNGQKATPGQNQDIIESEASTRPAPVLEGKVFEPGSYWVYETLDDTLTVQVTDSYEENGQTYYVYEFFYGGEKVAEEHRIHNDEMLATVKSVQGETTVVVFDPPLIRVKFPLKVGDKWENRWESNGVTVVSEVEVVSYEKIKTKGGVFLAYKIKHKTYTEGYEDDAVIDADWYNPEIGLIAYAKEGGENPKALVRYEVVEKQK